MKNHVVRLALLIAAIAAPSAVVAQIVVLSETVTERAATSGDSYTGTIRVRNTSREAQTARVSQNDYLFYADGRNVFGRPGSVARSNASWITFSPEQITLAPGQTGNLQYTVRVPDARSQPISGTYWSLLMIETIAPGSAESALRRDQQKSHVGLRTKTRYAVQIATHAGTSSQPSLSFENVRAVASRGQEPATLSLDVSNSSEQAVRPRMSVELYGPNGELVEKITQARGLVYPGTSFRQDFKLGSLPPGRYKAIVLGDAGSDEIFGGQYDVAF